LTDATGAVTDTYTYDAFGNLINSTGSTANNYLFAGEQYDPDLGLYYNRARYLDVRVGRFWGMDEYEGEEEDPSSLHEYAYTKSDPVNGIDPSGHDDIGIVSSTLDATVSLPNITIVFNMAVRVATTVSTLGLKFITAEEGLKTHLYPDSANNCTVGVGHLVHLGPCNGTDPSEKPFLHGISRQQALDMLTVDSLTAVTILQQNTKVPLKQQEFDAVTDFIFNEKYRYIGSDLRKELNEGNYFLVPPLFLHFTRAGGDPNALMGRRLDESRLFEFGMYVRKGVPIY
jgi:RHS repeat-associated protein